MKKFLKFFTIFVLIGLTIGGTCYIFYSNLIAQKDAFVPISTFLNGADKVELDDKIYAVNDLANNNLIVTIETSEKLDEILNILNTYMVCSLDYDVDNNEIVKRLDNAIKIRDKLSENVDEYNSKSNNPYADFDEVLGSNNIYRVLADYITSYADMIKFMNKEIKSNMISNKSSDVKFDIIELYCNVAIDSFSHLVINNNLVSIKDSNNINLLNSKLNFINNMIDSSTTAVGGDLSYLNNNFIKAYSKVDKSDFANNLYTNVSIVNSISNDSTNVEKATYYIKQILGM